MFFIWIKLVAVAFSIGWAFSEGHASNYGTLTCILTVICSGSISFMGMSMIVDWIPRRIGLYDPDPPMWMTNTWKSVLGWLLMLLILGWIVASAFIGAHAPRLIAEVLGDHVSQSQ
jgi:hypothetical protein